MLFSILINTHNQYELIDRCIKSCLNQDYNEDYQVIISDTSDIKKIKKYEKENVSIKVIEADSFSNFPCVEGPRPWSLEQILHVVWSDQFLWHVRALGTVSPGKSVVWTSDELPPELPDNASPFFFFHPKKLPATLDRLIISDLMHTQPNWRANIQLFSPFTSILRLQKT